MKRPLDQLRELARKHNAPIVCGGDVFHHWLSTPELINFAIANLPKMYAVPGQHDLPHHNYADIKKSAYWTLVCAGAIINLVPGAPTPAGPKLTLYGFPWGFMPGRQIKKGSGLHLAVVHHYVWKSGFNYPGALQECHVDKLRESLEPYDAAVFGDNHKGFVCTDDRPHILNCGGFMRRTSDEEDYRPKVALLYSDGTFEQVELDTTGEVLIKTESEDKIELLDTTEFVELLKGAGVHDLDFSQMVRNYLRENKSTIRPSTRKIITSYLEQCQ